MTAADSLAPVRTFTRDQAVRLALASQGFGVLKTPARPSVRTVDKVVACTGLFQIDSVNVLARAHYLPMYSRIGPYPPAIVDRAAYGTSRSLFEYWGHEASLLPVDVHPLLRWRMAEAHHGAWGGMRTTARDHPGLLDEVLAIVAARGPVSAGEIEQAHFGERIRSKGAWWDWSIVKKVVEFLFWSGQVTTAQRRGFERLYDLSERVIPAEVLAQPTPSKAAAQRALIIRSAEALGVSTGTDLRDYFRLTAADATARINELVEGGDLLPAAVEGWRGPVFIRPNTPEMRPRPTSTLISPFDPLIWSRKRTERLFGFRYRLEIYTPAARRVHGYYVLPFLHAGRLVARVDLKADRAASVLIVRSSWAEPEPPTDVAEALASELARMARWQKLADVVVEERGDLAQRLAAQVRS